MSVYSEIREKLEGFKASGGGASMGGLMIAEVKSVEGDTCTIEVDDDLDLSDVRLRVVSDNNTSSKMLLTPKIGSFVLVADLSGGDLSDMAVVMFSEVEKIIINGGNNGGLVKINDLVNHLNTIENDINALKLAVKGWTPVAQDGGAALKTALGSWYEQQITPTEVSDMEDDNVKH